MFFIPATEKKFLCINCAFTDDAIACAGQNGTFAESLGNKIFLTYSLSSLYMNLGYV